VEKVAAHGVRAGYVRAPATPGVMAPTVGREEKKKEKREKPLDYGENMD
jgi:hypothetical protein